MDILNSRSCKRFLEVQEKMQIILKAIIIVYCNIDICGTVFKQNLKETVHIFAMDFHKNETAVMCYRTFPEQSVIKCLKKCLKRGQRCQFIRHNRHFRTCSLCESSADGYETKHSLGDVLIDVAINRDWLVLIDPACLSMVCQRTEKCVDGDCVNSECDWPSRVKGTLYPTDVQTSFGTNLRFDCLDNSIPECPIIRKCKWNTTWTEQNIESALTGSGNIALGKQAEQSSTYSSEGLADLNIYPTADLAVDGDTNGVFNDGTCTHTTGATPSWWRVDLADIYWISRLVIYNRMESPERLNNLNITAGVTLGNMLFCAYFEGPGTSENLVEDIYCEQPLYGRYVRIEKVKGGGALTLCEVKIFS